jgi:hypothetical protein
MAGGFTSSGKGLVALPDLQVLVKHVSLTHKVKKVLPAPADQFLSLVVLVPLKPCAPKNPRAPEIACP